jgi:hypothetical protein
MIRPKRRRSSKATSSAWLALITAMTAACVSPTSPSPRLTLNWDSNPDVVDGYRVYKGTTAAAGEMTPLLDVQPQAGGRQTVSWTFDELGVASGEQICFRLKALRGAETSDFSQAICIKP